MLINYFNDTISIDNIEWVYKHQEVIIQHYIVSSVRPMFDSFQTIVIAHILMLLKKILRPL